MQTVKRVKLDTNLGDVKCGIVNIYVLPHKIQKRRLDILLQKSRDKSLPIVDDFSYVYGHPYSSPSIVSHVVTEHESIEQTVRALQCDDRTWNGNISVVTSAWLSECIKAGHVVDILPVHRVIAGTGLSEKIEEVNVAAVAEYACQRAAVLEHFNKKFCDALEILENFARMNDHTNNARGLAFKRAAATLASLPVPITRCQQLANLPDIGEHCKRVIEDILNTGSSSEVETVLADEWYQKMKLFTGVFGVGPATAKKWIQNGISSIDDALIGLDNITREDPRIGIGLRYYSDLTCTLLLKSEAESVQRLVAETAESLLPGTTVELVGGFRRGKEQGHDIDLLISHPIEGRENELLERILTRFEQRGLVLYGKSERSTYNNDESLTDKGSKARSTLDHFEKWIGVLKIDKKIVADGCSSSDNDCLSPDACSVLDEAKGRQWTARRVDLIVVPASQYPYALVGWTGNKHFNRSLRLYAQRRFNYKLSSHALYDVKSKIFLRASNEREVFNHLQLTYREPFERNC